MTERPWTKGPWLHRSQITSGVDGQVGLAMQLRGVYGQVSEARGRMGSTGSVSKDVAEAMRRMDADNRLAALAPEMAEAILEYCDKLSTDANLYAVVGKIRAIGSSE